MDDKDFLNMAHKIIDKADENVIQMNEDARIAIIFEKNGHECIKQFLLNHLSSECVMFERNEIYPNECNYDLRKLMDGEYLNEIATIGYTYDYENSTSDSLRFIKHISSRKETD